MAHEFEVTVRLVKLSERKPTPEACDLFGSVLAIGVLRDRQEVTYNDLSPHDIERIIDAGQAENWYWLELSSRVVVDKITESFARTLDRT